MMRQWCLSLKKKTFDILNMRSLLTKHDFFFVFAFLYGLIFRPGLSCLIDGG